MTAFRNLLLALLFALPLAAAAETTAAPDAEALKEAERLLDIMEVDLQMQAAMTMMLDVEFEQKPEMRKFRGVMEAFLAKHMSYAALKDEMVAMYASEFTVAELRKAIEFYGSEEGKAMLRKMPRMMQLGGELGQRRVEENMDELVAAIQAEQARLAAEDELAEGATGAK